ncbi:unnamed protein product, partial [Mesorhabditis belari]|uniref:Uncharacterized protein n=1 Tax=Mesorhabditis belari TaxID=2138241 RepID=A0AAF3J2G6_9BILA
MSGAIESRIEVAPCGCEESVQLRHRNNSLQEQLQYLTDVVGTRNEDLRQKNDHLEADNKKLRRDVEILKGGHQLHADVMNNALIYSSELFGKDEPTGKKEMSGADVQTEDFGHLEDGCTVCTTIEAIGAHCQQLLDEQTAMEKELGSAAQKIAMFVERLEMELAAKQAIEAHCQQLLDERAGMEKELGSATRKIAMFVERLEIELEAKQALQADYDRVKADQEQFLLEFEELVDLYRKAVEQNEKLRDEMENQGLVTLGSSGALDQAFRSDFDSLEEAIAKQNDFDQRIVNVLKKQGPGTSGCFKPLLVGFLVIVIVFFATLASVSVSIDLTDPNALYDRHHYA